MGRAAANLGRRSVIVGGCGMRVTGGAPALRTVPLVVQTPPDVAASTSVATVPDEDSVTMVPGTRGPLPPRGSDRTNLPVVSTVPLDARTGVNTLAWPGVERAVDATVRVSHPLTPTSTVIGTGWTARPGYVVTNAHVVGSARDVDVRDRAGNRHAGSVVVTDPAHDLALVRVPDLRTPALAFDDLVEVDEQGAGVGYPHDSFRVSVDDARATVGVRSGANDPRTVLAFEGTADPGNSGGPIVNANGEVLATTFAVAKAASNGLARDLVFGVRNDDVRVLLDRAGLDARGVTTP